MRYIDAKSVIDKFNSLKTDRVNWENVWQELAEYIQPRKNDIQKSSLPGEKKFTNILDSTAMTNNELLSGALHGMLTNPSGYFFNLSTGVPDIDKLDVVRKWLQNTVRLIHDILNNSNFQTEVHEVYLDLCCFGTSCMLVEEDEQFHVRFSTKPLKEIYADENSKGIIDCIYRVFKMDARALADVFGFENLPQKVQESYKKGKHEDFEVIHAMYPQNEIIGTGNFDPSFKWVSHYVLMNDKSDLSVRGFHEFPYVTPRWTKISGETYGRGPGEKALPSAKTLNAMRKTVLKGAQKVVDPPLQAPDDGFITQIDTRPSGISYYRAGSQDRITPIFNDSRIDFGFQAIDQERVQVREAFYADQLKLREGPQMTATEVSERVEQALRFLGPMLGRQQFEFLQPLIERVYNILDRKGMIPDPPFQVQGKPLRIQYSSVMAMSQRLSELQSIQRTMQNITPFASFDPGVMDNFDADSASRYIAKLTNFPQEILRDQEAMMQMRQQRAQAQQQEQEMLQQQMQVDNTSKVLGAASKMKAAQGQPGA